MNDLSAPQGSRLNLLYVLSAVAFVGAVFTRSVDPMIPLIASDLSVPASTVALLTTAYALPFALAQPFLGSLSDALGKSRIIFVCLACYVVATLMCGLAFGFSQLFTLRMIAGIAGGGMMPVMLALVADNVPIGDRRVAISRLTAGSTAGNLSGSLIAGIVSDLFGWRMVFLVGAVVGTVVLVLTWAAIRQAPQPKPPGINVRTMLSNFGALFRNSGARICFTAVLIEGAIVQGMYPYISLMLHDSGETRASIAGLVISFFGLGALCYSFSIRFLSRYASDTVITMIGGSAVAVGLVIIGSLHVWYLMAPAMFMMGLSFFLVHGWIQAHVSEFVPSARGAAMSLHAFFLFLGFACGPVVYGYLFPAFGSAATLAVSALLFVAMTLWLTFTLVRPLEKAHVT